MAYFLTHCSYVETYEPEHEYTFTGPCVITEEPYSVKVRAADLYAYHKGAKIQDAFPSIPADQREFMISGTSPEGWKQVFGGDDDDEDDDDSDSPVAAFNQLVADAKAMENNLRRPT